MALNIAALFVYIFGAYAYGYLLWLWLRDRTPGRRASAPRDWRRTISTSSVTLFFACAIWFVLNAIIEFRLLMGEARGNDFVDLAALELVLLFPGLIFHNYLSETRSTDRPLDRAGWWQVGLWGLYAAGGGLAVYFTSVIFGLVPEPEPLGAVIGISIGTLFTVMSVFCLFLMNSSPPRSSTNDERSLRTALRGLFLTMIVVFVALNLMREHALLIALLDVGVRTTPLFFLLVSVYFEHRIRFYDLIVKRGALLMLSLLLTGVALALAFTTLDRLPSGAAGPWLIAVLLLPVAMFMPWLHDQAGRLLDRLWFGREFTPVDAVKHVLGAMQQATDERTLIAATEATMSDIFQRPVTILVQHQPLPEDRAVVHELRMPSGDGAVRLTVSSGSLGRSLFSEDLALLRSLGGVFVHMLENVRLQRKRGEQEQLAQELRIQSSRSELKALRAQINPHFLFNALNAIASLIHTDPARADAAVEQLAEVFRYTLRRSEQEWAPLDQELTFARAYLDVEQARFGRRLEFTIDADPRLSRAHVPAMLLQTLVENAVKHGIARLRTPGRIDVAARLEQSRVVLEVRDTGPGLQPASPTASSGESFGLRSIRDRLRGHFGDGASVDLRRNGAVTVARIELPLIEDLAMAAGAARA